jgi:hypothetical protein
MPVLVSKFELFESCTRRLLGLCEHPAFYLLFYWCPTTTRFPLYIDADHDVGPAPGSSLRQRRHQAVLQPKNCGWLSPPRSWLSWRGILDGQNLRLTGFPKDDSRSKWKILDRIEIKSVGNDLIFSVTGRSPVLKFSGRSSTGIWSLSKTPNASVNPGWV